MTALDLIKSLWEHTRQPTDIISELSLIGSDPVLPSSFHVDKMAQTVIALTALGAAEIWRQRTGEIQSISVDINHAAAEFLETSTSGFGELSSIRHAEIYPLRPPIGHFLLCRSEPIPQIGNSRFPEVILIINFDRYVIFRESGTAKEWFGIPKEFEIMHPDIT
jgi:hypothetical protein